MYRQKKRMSMFSAIALVLVLSLVFSGCGTNKNEASPSASSTSSESPSSAASESPSSESPSPSEPANSEHVELTMHMMNSPVKDFDRIMEKANKIINEKINATLKLVINEPSSYAQKLNLMVSSGEPFDIAFTSSGMDLNYFQQASKGAFKSITDLLGQYAPVTKSRVPDAVWNGVKVNGKIYASINYQVWGMAGARGVQLRKDFVDKYNFDWKSVTKWDDLTPFFEAVKQGEPGIIPWEADDVFADIPVYYGMDAVGDTKVPGWVRYGDEDIKVFNQYETDEYKAYLKTVRDWYKKGYIRKDAATLKDVLPDRKASKYAAIYAQPYPDMIDMPESGENAFMAHSPPADKVYAYIKRFTEPFIASTTPSIAVLAIGANSKNPERAMQLIELINTNDELWHLLVDGEEGVDYKKIGEKQKEMIPDTYNFNWNEWQIGQSYGRLYFDQNTNVDIMDKQLQMIYDADKTAMISPIMGFVFDFQPVKTQVANVNAVMTELLEGLDVGAVDPDKYYDSFIKKLKDAGADDIIAEKQKQIDEWKAANGK